MHQVFQVDRSGQTNTIPHADSIVMSYLARYPGLRIFEGEPVPGAEAMYTPAKDRVIIHPKRHPMFGGKLDNWYSALFHELTHSTGHPARTNRDVPQCGHCDPFNYGVEELTAELGASFLTEECGISSTRKAHADYLKRFIYEIGAGPNTMVRATEQAAEGVELILGHGCRAVDNAMRLVA